MTLLLALLFQDAAGYAPVHALFQKHCASCHDAKKAEGDFVTDTHALVLKGSADGPVLVPGKPAESRILPLLDHSKKPYMPPPKKGGKLKPEEIDLLRAWIAAGAPGPKAGETPAAPAALPKIAPRKAPARAARAAAASRGLVALAKGHDVELLPADGKAVLRTLSGHRGLVNAVALSPDASLVLAASGEPGVAGEARLWSAADGKLLRTYSGHADAVYAAAFAPDGRIFATASYDRSILVWDKDQDKPLREIEGHNEAVTALAFRADGKVLASASGDRTVKLWTVADGKRLETLSESTKALTTLAWSPDGKRLAAAGVDNRIRVWSVSEGAKEGENPLLHSTFAHDQPLLRLAWSDDGAWIASSAEDRTVKLWRASDMNPGPGIEAQPDWPAALAFTPGGKTLVVGRLDGTHRVYEVSTGKAVAKQAAAPPAKPELTGASPRGFRAGETTKVRLSGKNLAGLAQVRVHGSAATATLAGPATADHVDLELAVPASPAAGELELSLSGPGGETNKIKAWIDPLPQVGETEGAETSAPLPASFWGVLATRGDADEFRFEAKAGELLVLDAAAKRIGSKAELVLSLLDEAGRPVAVNIDFEGEADPLVVARIPATGRYTARVRDLQLGASADHHYRLSIGVLPLVTAVFPLSVPANAETEVRLVGPNVPAGTTVRVRAGAGAEGEAAVPVDPARFRPRRAFTVAVAAAPEVLEAEDNDRPAQAQPLSVPGGATGAFQGPGDADLYAFDAKAGRRLVVETFAARRGLPTDTRIELLDAQGRAVPRVLLRAVRDSYLTFRPIDSNGNGGRFWQWEEMDLGQYLYLQGEVVRLLLAPRGPDSTWDFFTASGKRRTYFGTTATAHALEEPAYIVEPHPPGTRLPPNGLPLFPLSYVNDDDPDRRGGADSRLLFEAPADGRYLVRVTESRGGATERHLYRLVVREAKPGFRASIEGAQAAVPLGSGTSFTVKIDRQDGFEGPVRVEISGLPAGFRASGPIIVDEGHTEAKGVLFADPDATKPALNSVPKAVAFARVGAEERRQDVAGLGALDLVKAPRTRVWIESVDGSITLLPGGRVPAVLKIQREGHNDRVTFDVENLPFGSIVDDIGLNGILIAEGQTERKVFLTCAPWTAPGSRPAYARVREGPNPCSAPVEIRVPARN